MGNDLPNLIWVDCEMTGLDLNKDALVEIAVLVTDAQLNILGEGVDLVIKTTPEKLAGMDDFVKNMHTCLLYTSPSPRDGLLSRMPSSA